MNETVLLNTPKPAGPFPGRGDQDAWARQAALSGRPGGTQQAPKPFPPLAVQLRARLSSLTALEGRVLSTLIHRCAIDEDTLLKCAAGDAGVSEALIVKIAKKLGFEGFRQLRAALAEDRRVTRMDLHEELCVGEGACGRLRKILGASVRALEQSFARLSPEALDRAADCLHTARQRDFYGVGSSAQVAWETARRFLRIGVRVSVFDDGQLMHMSAALLRRGDVAVAFSHSGQTAVVVEAARQARQNGAVLIAFTNRSDSPLGREADVPLCTNFDGSPCAGESAASRVVQLNLLEALFGAVAQKDCAAAEANLGRTAAATRGWSGFRVVATTMDASA
ncbi:MAG TPA: SIS domain-containing protein [Chthoniobacterales bacterium]